MGNLPIQKHTWEQWTDEIDLAYSYFVTYIELGLSDQQIKNAF